MRTIARGEEVRPSPEPTLFTPSCPKIERSDPCFSSPAQVLQSYLPLETELAERQEELTSQYGFTCTCERCEREARWAAEGEEEGEEVVVGGGGDVGGGEGREIGRAHV